PGASEEGSAQLDARVGSALHRRIDPLANGRQLDVDELTRRAKTGAQMGVVAERLVRRLTAATEGGARQHLHGTVLVRHVDAPAHEQRAVAHRDELRRLGATLLRSAV